MKFTLKAEGIGYNEATKSTNTMEFEGECLGDITRDIATFLRGAGFFLDGLEVINENLYEDTLTEEQNEEQDEEI
jgi:uncharacterized protein (DUF934 family)